MRLTRQINEVDSKADKEYCLALKKRGFIFKTFSDFKPVDRLQNGNDVILDINTNKKVLNQSVHNTHLRVSEIEVNNKGQSNRSNRHSLSWWHHLTCDV